VGKLAKGINSDIIDLIFVGDDINKNYLLELIDKTEKIIKRHIRYMVFSINDIEAYIQQHSKNDMLLLWKQEV